MKQSNKPLFCALAVLAVFTLVGIATSHAQTVTLQPAQPRDENPLFANSGANVLPAGSLMLDGGFGLSRLGVDNDYGANGSTDITSRSFIPDARLRVGLGLGIEVSLGFGALFTSDDDEIISLSNTLGYPPTLDTFSVSGRSVTVVPTLAARMQLFEGRGWLPQVTFLTRLAVPLFHTTQFSSNVGLPTPDDRHEFSPLLGLQFRNRLGDRWVLDYSLAYEWNHRERTANTVGDADLLFSLGARWLATDRLMLGALVENYGGRLEATFQASPALQLTASAAYHQGYDFYDGHSALDARLGVAWRIK